MTTPLFSTFRQGENRVTATLVAVLERLSLPNIDRIIRALLEDGDFSLVSFQNQVKVKGKRTIPDAKIGMGHAILIETKTACNKVGRRQIEGHLEHVQPDEKLLLLTPHDSAPSFLSEPQFSRVVWANFITLSGVIEAILNDEDDENEPPTEREAFLLREFIRMLEQDGLLSPVSAKDRVLVIPARIAYPLYEHLDAYVTKPKTFRPSDHIAFYVRGKIEPIAPKIELIIDRVQLTEDEIPRLNDEGAKERAYKLRDDILRLNDPKADYGVSDGYIAKVMFLSRPDDAKTIKLEGPIINDNQFTYGSHRYVTLESLKKARKTSELEHC